MPTQQDQNRKDHCVTDDFTGTTTCNGGYKCLHFKCYPDNPTGGNSQGGQYTYVCGNYVK